MPKQPISFATVKRLVEEQTHFTIFLWQHGFAVAAWDSEWGQWAVENLTSDTLRHGRTPKEAAAKCWRVKLWSLSGIVDHLNIDTQGY